MTNEELAVAIRSGSITDYMLLWSQVDKFVRKRARDFLGGNKQVRGATEEDLMQSGFIAMVSAVNAYDPEGGGSFITYFNYHIKNQFRIAACMRNPSSINDAFHKALSLDCPVDAEEDVALIDLQMDPEDKYESTEVRILNDQLHETLETALNELPEGEADILRKRFYQQMTVAALAELKGKSPNQIKSVIARALRQLQTRAKKNGLDQYIEDRTNYYRRSSFRTSQTSAVEWLVMKRAEVEEQYRNRMSGEDEIQN